MTLSFSATRRAVLGGIVAIMLPAAALAASPEIFTSNGSGLAMGGYDAVAYFKDGKPVPGSKDITTSWKGATWRFVSAENRDAFAAKPESYAPQFGGYCAFAVAHGSTAPGDPKVWKIVDGKLYLNLSPGVQKQWERDIPGNISRGTQNWSRIVGK